MGVFKEMNFKRRYLRSFDMLLAVLLFLVLPGYVHAQQEDQFPLAPVDASSPQATMVSFMSELEEAYRLGLVNQSGSQQRLENAVQLFDFSQAPPRFPLSAKIETALWLKEVLDRIERPSIEDIPGVSDEMPARWRLPNTPITIQRVEDGDRAGDYLFSSETVERAEDMFDRVKSLPYRENATPDIYLAYSTTPGQGLDVGFARMLPDWSKQTLAGQTYWQWIAVAAALLVLAVSYIPAALLLRRVRHAADGENIVVSLVYCLSILFAAVVCWVTADTLDERVNITDDWLKIMMTVLSVMAYLTIAWFVIVAVPTFSAVLRRLWGISSSDSRGLLLRLAEWVLTLLLIGVLFVQFAHEQGWPAYSIVTGLGVGGIAIGFGAQTLVRDILSGVFFLMDDAFREGEYVNVGVAKGTVEKISIRSVQLRHHLGQLNTVPFGEISNVENFSRDWIVTRLPVRVPFDTDIKLVRKLVKKLGQDLLEDPELGSMFIEPLKSQGVVEIDEFGLLTRVKYMTKPGDQFTIRQAVFTRLQERFQEHGISFAGVEQAGLINHLKNSDQTGH